METINEMYKGCDDEISMIATDVAALFPSMDAAEAGRACRTKIEESNLTFDETDYE